MKKKLFIDFDGTLVNTIKRITELYNEDFKYYEGFSSIEWSAVETWSFNELSCASKAYINQYFNQPRFFDESLEIMPFASIALGMLRDKYDIYVVSMGETPNLRAKKLWLKRHLPYVEFVGCNLNDHHDKSHIDMKDGIIVDDNEGNLCTSNAAIKICFGDIYDWNKNFDGIRCENWRMVLSELIN